MDRRGHWIAQLAVGWAGLAVAALLVSTAWWVVMERVPIGSLSALRWDRMLLARARVVEAASPPRPKPSSPALALPRGMVLGYFYDPGDPAGSLQFLRRYQGVLSGLIPFWYTVAANGAVSGTAQANVLQWARRHHLWVFALVGSQDAQALDALLQDPAAEARATAEILALCQKEGFGGINLDWEGIAPDDRQALSTFVAHLAQTLHHYGYLLTLSLPAETKDAPADSWTGAYDYRALGQAADLVMVMAYDQHWSGGPPGPIASPSWVRQVLSYAISVIPPAKVILGVPGYGYDWSGNGSAVALSYPQAVALEKQFDPKSRGNHFVYIENGTVHSVWFEDTASFLSKIGLVTGYELRGIALWRLGIEDPRIWDFLQ
ncbi:MAG: glycoside hydrolase [Firmicutes bacterium]|nr:glycoside hydrolase [Alicyclobacillaceae bacterium]MCL6497143.1 glycoside hydrolase [Bacillota bacterium]